MPTRVHLTGGDREWTVEVTEREAELLEPGQTLTVTRHPDQRLAVATGAGRVEGVAVRHRDEVWVTISGRVLVFTVGRQGLRHVGVERDALMVPMPSTVVRVAVQPNQTVRHGDLLVALEAMKMELTVRAPRDGVVRAVHCREGELVPAGKVLVDM